METTLYNNLGLAPNVLNILTRLAVMLNMIISLLKGVFRIFIKINNSDIKVSY